MDLFGKKRMAELERANALLDEQVFLLITEIRSMDQDIWDMSQQLSWERMQPYFRNLQVDMEHRKQEESRRIESVLIPEMKKAYL